MPTIPPLKTGQVTQHPLVRTISQNVDTVSFLDGTEQRCPISRPLHQWTIHLALLDQQELSALAMFVEQQAGVGVFEFRDPVDGVNYPRCTFVPDTWMLEVTDQGRAATTLVIREEPQ
jgi:phage-related protein